MGYESRSKKKKRKKKKQQQKKGGETKQRGRDAFSGATVVRFVNTVFSLLNNLLNAVDVFNSSSQHSTSPYMKNCNY